MKPEGFQILHYQTNSIKVLNESILLVLFSCLVVYFMIKET